MLQGEVKKTGSQPILRSAFSRGILFVYALRVNGLWPIRPG